MSPEKSRVFQLGLSQSDITVIKTILQASRTLSDQFEYVESAEEEFEVLLVNADAPSAVSAGRVLTREQREVRVIMVSSQAAPALSGRLGSVFDQACTLKRPVSPRTLEQALTGEIEASSARSSARVAAVTRQVEAPRARAKSVDQTELKVLVVDDSLPAREFIKIKVKELCNHAGGVLIDTTHSGEDALKKIEQVMYDLVFLDVEMDGMDGFETCKRIKQRFDKMRVAMLTGKSLSQDYARGREVGCNHYLTKPPHDNDVKTILTLSSLSKSTM